MYKKKNKRSEEYKKRQRKRKKRRRKEELNKKRYIAISGKGNHKNEVKISQWNIRTGLKEFLWNL